MKNIIFISALFILNALHSTAAGSYDNLWQKGNTYYAQKQYDSAAACYEQIAAAKPASAALYYNLGNTYYRLNKVPMAVLNYERAIRIYPGYTEAKDNLALTETRIGSHIHTAGDIFFISWWKALTKPDRANSMAIAALVTFVLIIALMLIRRINKNGGRLPVQAIGLLWVIMGSFLLLSYVASANAQAHNKAVVMLNDAPLMNNSQQGKPLALLPEGTTVTIKEVKGPWAEVRLADGRNGWLQQAVIEKI